MIIDLDAEASLDPGRAGSKAAWLAKGRRAGLPVLPGFVVEASESRDHMSLGAATLAKRGSGGARLAIMQQPLPFADELVDAGSRIGPAVVGRSSTALEGSGEWSGAFTSYVGLVPPELPRAVVGCWASAFSVAALGRLEAAGIEPGSFPMAVLVQRALDPAAGGTARIDDQGTVTVNAVKGSPAPMLQGWSTGHEARRDAGGSWVGEDLINMLGRDTLDEIAATMSIAHEALGATRCEWALDGQIWILQLGADEERSPTVTTLPTSAPVNPDLVRIARMLVRLPGDLGEDLVLPWALGGLPDAVPPSGEIPADAMRVALRLRDELVSQVWAMPAEDALAAVRQCMATLLGPDPRSALDRIRLLARPEAESAGRLLTLVNGLAASKREIANRLGVARWDPFVASVVLASGTHRRGTVASPGIGAGVRCHVGHPTEMGAFTPRAVITAPQPVPSLAPLLWDAAGLVTATGSPTAHLFDSARALGIPAVCGVELPEGDSIVAIDGQAGVVATLSLNGDDDV